MRKFNLPFRLALRRLALLTLPALLAACANTPPAPPPAGEQSLAMAVRSGTSHLMQQASQQRASPSFWAQWFPQTVMVMSVRDASTQEQTNAGLQAGELIETDIRQRHPGFRVMGNQEAQAQRGADLRLDTTLTPEHSADGTRSRGRYVLDQRLTSLQDGTTVARSRAIVADARLDTTPTRFYRDSPVTSAAGNATPDTPPAQAPAITDARQQANAAARLQAAGDLYARDKFESALDAYREALAMPGVNRLEALIGQYLSLVRLERPAQAHEAFAQIVSTGLATRSLGIKLLFSPGTTQYWPDPVVSKPYPGWLKEIAQQASRLSDCLLVAGHTSRSGAEAYNLALSQDRALEVSKQLSIHAQALAPRLQTRGVGWSQNLVGTGTDDLRDAVDRRVEFRVVPCP